MPLIARSQAIAASNLTPATGGGVGLGAPEETPPLGEVIRASFNRENTVFSMLADSRPDVGLDLAGREVDPDFDAPALLRGTELVPFASAFDFAVNKQEFDAIAEALRERIDDERTIHDAGLVGVLTSIAAGVLDPINILPVGRALSLARVATRGEAVGKTAAAGALANAAAEGVLQTADETRTAVESGVNVTAGAGLGALLGGALARGGSRTVTPDLRTLAEKEFGQTRPDAPLSPASVGARDALEIDVPEGLDEGTALRVKNAFGVQKFARFVQLPSARLIMHEEPLVRAATMRLIQIDATLRGVVGGITQPRAAETLATARQNRLTVKKAEILREAQRTASKTGIALNKAEAAKVMGRHLLFGEDVPAPLAKAAQRMRDEVFMPELREMKEAGLLGDVSAEEAFANLIRIYDTQAISTNPEKWRAANREWFRSQIEGPIEEGRVARVEEGDVSAELARVDADTKAKEQLLEARIAKAREPTKSGKPRKDAARREQSAQAQLNELRRKADAKREALTQRRGELREKVKRGEKSLRGLDEGDVDGLITTLGQRIAAAPRGRTPYNTHFLNLPNIPRYTITNNEIADFVETDLNLITQHFLRTSPADIEITKVFGDPELRAFIGDQVANRASTAAQGATADGRLNALFDTRIAAAREAGDGKEAERLGRLRKRTISDFLEASMALRNTHAAPPSVIMASSSQILRAFNLTTKLGKVVLSSFPDLIRPAMVNGMSNAFGPQIAVLLNRLRPTLVQASKGDLRFLGANAELVMNTRASELLALGDDFQAGNAAGQVANRVSQSFITLTLLPAWNSVMKDMAGFSTMRRMLKVGRKAPERRSKRDLEFIRSRLNLTDREFQEILDQAEKHGTLNGDVPFFNVQEWDSPAAVENLGAAITKTNNQIIVTPTAGDRPFFSRTPEGQLLFQFRSFNFAAVNKVLVSGIQQIDAAAVNGALISVMLGGISWLSKLAIAGGAVEDVSPEQFIAEGIDRSGMLAFFADANMLIERLTSNRVGLGAVGGKPLTRAISQRSVVEAVLGPSISSISDIAGVLNHLALIATGDDDLSAETIGRVQPIIPFSNIFWLQASMAAVAETAGQGSTLQNVADELR